MKIMAIFDSFFLFDDILNNLFYCIILLRYFTCDAHSASKLTESPAIIYFNNTRYTTVTENYFCKQLTNFTQILNTGRALFLTYVLLNPYRVTKIF